MRRYIILLLLPVFALASCSRNNLSIYKNKIEVTETKRASYQNYFKAGNTIYVDVIENDKLLQISYIDENPIKKVEIRDLHPKTKAGLYRKPLEVFENTIIKKAQVFSSSKAVLHKTTPFVGFEMLMIIGVLIVLFINIAMWGPIGNILSIIVLVIMFFMLIGKIRRQIRRWNPFKRKKKKKEEEKKPFWKKAE